MTVTRSRRLPLIALGLLLPVPVFAQYQAGQAPRGADLGGAVARAWNISPRISTAATVTTAGWPKADKASLGSSITPAITLSNNAPMATRS